MKTKTLKNKWWLSRSNTWS